MVIALIVVTVVTSAPIFACLLVSVASTREDSAHSLGNHAPGPVQAAARRLLDFHTDAPSWLAQPGPQPATPPTAASTSRCGDPAGAVRRAGGSGHGQLAAAESVHDVPGGTLLDPWRQVPDTGEGERPLVPDVVWDRQAG